MPLRERLLDEDETTEKVDDFSALILDDLKNSGIDESMLAQIADLTKGVNELHKESENSDRSKK